MPAKAAVAVRGKDLQTEWLKAVAARRCRASFKLLYAHYHPRIAKFLRNRGENERISEEIAQEVMIAVWQKAETFDAARANAATWIFTIARNAHIDLIRKEKRRSVDLSDPFFVPDPDPAPDDALPAETVSRRLAAAIEALPGDQAEIVRLCYLEGRRHREAADALGLPISVVKYRARAALERLRLAMGEDR